MKKIINGKKYDTDTAKCMGSYENEYGPSDFKCVEEHLYRKKNGDFFLYGEGGPMTDYAEHCFGGGWTWGEKIIPLTESEAKKWAENHLDCDDYEEIFGPVEE